MTNWLNQYINKQKEAQQQTRELEKANKGFQNFLKQTEGSVRSAFSAETRNAAKDVSNLSLQVKGLAKDFDALSNRKASTGLIGSLFNNFGAQEKSLKGQAAALMVELNGLGQKQLALGSTSAGLGGLKSREITEIGLRIKDVNKELESLSNSKIGVSNVDKAFGFFGTTLGKIAGSVIAVNSAIMLLTAGMAGLRRLWGATVGGIIEEQAKYEDNMLRFTTAFGSFREAESAMKGVVDYALRTPFTLKEITQSAVNLSAVLRGGKDELLKWIPAIGDISAYSGLKFEDVTTNMIRAFSGGINAARMFRIRGVSDLLGFQAGKHYSPEETVKKFEEAMKGFDSRFAGLTDNLARNWNGMVSMMEDHWLNFQLQVAQAGFFDTVKSGLRAVLDLLDQWKNNGNIKSWAIVTSAALTDLFNMAVNGLGRFVNLLLSAYKMKRYGDSSDEKLDFANKQLAVERREREISGLEGSEYNSRMAYGLNGVTKEAWEQSKAANLNLLKSELDKQKSDLDNSKRIFEEGKNIDQSIVDSQKQLEELLKKFNDNQKNTPKIAMGERVLVPQDRLTEEDEKWIKKDAQSGDSWRRKAALQGLKGTAKAQKEIELDKEERGIVDQIGGVAIDQVIDEVNRIKGIPIALNKKLNEQVNAKIIDENEVRRQGSEVGKTIEEQKKALEQRLGVSWDMLYPLAKKAESYYGSGLPQSYMENETKKEDARGASKAEREANALEKRIQKGNDYIAQMKAEREALSRNVDEEMDIALKRDKAIERAKANLYGETYGTDRQDPTKGRFTTEFGPLAQQAYNETVATAQANYEVGRKKILRDLEKDIVDLKMQATREAEKAAEIAESAGKSDYERGLIALEAELKQAKEAKRREIEKEAGANDPEIQAKLNDALSKIDEAHREKVRQYKSSTVDQIDKQIKEVRFDETAPTEYERSIFAINQRYAELVTKSPEVQAEVEKLKEAMAEHYNQNGTFWDGMQKGFKQVSKDQDTFAQMGVDVTKTAAQSMSSSFQTFFDASSSGFLKMKTLVLSVATSIHQALLKVVTDKMIAKLFGFAFDALSMGVSSSTRASTASGTQAGMASGHWSQGGNWHAKGDAMYGPGISAFSNQVVSKPTFFWASGGNIMGEAGPEGILPLRRLSNGDLGVQALGTGGGMVVTNNINMQGSSGNAAADDRYIKTLVKELEKSNKAAMADQIRNQRRGGGLLY